MNLEILLYFVSVMGTSSVFGFSSENIFKGRFNPVVRGGFILALVSSLPELRTLTSSTSMNAPDAGIVTIVGSAIFNGLIIIGAAAILAKSGILKVDRNILLKDNMIYLGILSVVLISFTMLGTQAGEGKILIGTNIGYFLISLYIGYLIYLFVSYQNSEQKDEIIGGIPLALNIILMIGSFVGMWYSCHELVRASLVWARLSNFSEVFIGLSLWSMATSLPELAISITESVRGKGSEAVANPIGSNLLDITGVTGAGIVVSEGLTITVSGSGPAVIALYISALAITITMEDGKCSRLEGAGMVSSYIVWVLLYIMSPLVATIFSVATGVMVATVYIIRKK